MNTLLNMEAFARVVEAGSFTEAARRWGRSKAVVSKYVAQLEAHLGVQLLQRTTRALNLTETGRAYHERCRTILESVQELEAAVQASHTAPRGTLRLTLPDGLGHAHHEDLLVGFLERYPEVVAEVEYTNRMVDLVHEGFDVALRVTSPQDAALVARRLAEVPVIACTSPEYLARSGTPQRPEELANHRCIVDTNYRIGNRWRFVIAGKEVVVPVSGPARVNTPLAVRTLVLRGVGIGLITKFVVQPFLDDGRLVELFPGTIDLRWGVYAVYPRRKHLSGKVRAFVEHAAAVLSVSA